MNIQKVKTVCYLCDNFYPLTYYKYEKFHCDEIKKWVSDPFNDTCDKFKFNSNLLFLKKN